MLSCKPIQSNGYNLVHGPSCPRFLNPLPMLVASDLYSRANISCTSEFARASILVDAVGRSEDLEGGLTSFWGLRGDLEAELCRFVPTPRAAYSGKLRLPGESALAQCYLQRSVDR